MNVHLIAFTDLGYALARTLADALSGDAVRNGPEHPLSQWTEEHFQTGHALVFIGACGIAVRAIAPHVARKDRDPAVVVVDECGLHAIPLLSGHLGGANQLARNIGAICGAVPVITTATDLHHLFAVDLWAKEQGLRLLDPDRIRSVSSALLRGESVRVCSTVPIDGTPPSGVLLTEDPHSCDVLVSPCPGDAETPLRLVPPNVVLGVGCRRGIEPEALESALSSFRQDTGLAEESIFCAATLDLKQNEPGLLSFCRSHGWELHALSAETLRSVPGQFTGSAFVEQITGVDNVCERAAVAVSGGSLLCRKYARSGVTLAAAMGPVILNWGDWT